MEFEIYALSRMLMDPPRLQTKKKIYRMANVLHLRTKIHCWSYECICMEEELQTDMVKGHPQGNEFIDFSFPSEGAKTRG